MISLPTTFTEYFLAFAIIFDSSIAWFVLLKNPRRPINQAYFFMIFWITVWQISNFITSYVLLPYGLALFFSRLAFAAAAILVPGMLYFVSIFPNHHHRPKFIL